MNQRWLVPLKPGDSFEPFSGAGGSDADWLYRYFTQGLSNDKSRRAARSAMQKLAWFMAKQKISDLADLTIDDASMFKFWLESEVLSSVHIKDAVDVGYLPGGKSLAYLPYVKGHEDIGPQEPFFTESGEFNELWRPFRQVTGGSSTSTNRNALSPESVKTLLRLISSCFEFMRSNGHLTRNPWLKLNKNPIGPSASKEISVKPYQKALSINAVSAMFAYLRSMEFKGSERSRITQEWLIILLYEHALRVETLTELTRHNIETIESRDAVESQLRFKTKGGKEVKQYFSADRINSLREYRSAIGLHWPPKRGESEYLFSGIGRGNRSRKAISTQSIRKMLSNLGAATAYWAEHQTKAIGKFDPATWTINDAEQLRAIYPHSMRHSFISHALNHFGEDIYMVADHAGHSNISTTELYRQRGDKMHRMSQLHQSN